MRTSNGIAILQILQQGVLWGGQCEPQKWGPVAKPLEAFSHMNSWNRPLDDVEIIPIFLDSDMIPGVNKISRNSECSKHNRAGKSGEEGAQRTPVGVLGGGA